MVNNFVVWHNIETMLATGNQLEKLTSIFQNGIRLQFKKGEYVIRPGDPPPGVFLIDTGLVKAYDITKYGEENMLIVRKEHEIFPLIWAVTGQERHVIYQALGPTVVWRLSREDFLKELRQNPELIQPLLDMTIEMYRIHSERILNLEYRSVRERLVSFLLTMDGRFGKKNSHGSVIEVPLRRQDIASSINATRESTGKELAVLEKKGCISSSSLYITIHDKAALKKFLR